MPHSKSAMRRVFVYGTLRRGGRNDIERFSPTPRHLGDGAIAGTLYDLGSYPGASLGGLGRIFGEVYEITASVEAQLDVLEEVEPDGSGEYARREVSVMVEGTPCLCLVYEIHPLRVLGRPVIASGDWFDRASFS